MHLERPRGWNTKIPRPYKTLMRHFLPGVRRLNISPQNASLTKTGPLQPCDSHSQDSSPCLELGFAGQNKFLVWEMPLQAHSQTPAGSQQVCWMHIRTCWAVTCPGWSKHWRKASPSWDWLLLQSRICAHGEERKWLFTKRSTQRRPTALGNFSPQVILALSHPLQPSHTPCRTHLGLSAQGMDVPADENVVAPSPAQHETCDTQASALLCKGECQFLFMLEQRESNSFPKYIQ